MPGRRAGRFAALAACLLAAAATTTAARADLPAACIGPIVDASYDAPTGRYPHGALGDDLEWGRLKVRIAGQPPCSWPYADLVAVLPETRVFEDTEPRLADLDGDGAPEVIVVESHRDLGARLAIWGLRRGALDRIAATPAIGTRFRWLAPLGAADLDGDGRAEIAYVDRPHLARTLRIVRLQGSRLRPVAEAYGHTNHRIGDTTISGGIRDCGTGPEIITASPDWSDVQASRLSGGTLRTQVLDAGDLSAAMECR
ncbi:VCBS repeat-containing protein [Roseicyclus sp. F158]|uniref:VCBS repeat-containing protein n=1 Tax=Tropicimonas omnivorans TaxID=3075590 RepID=A0ABU3DF80_9RHOB|nr:VCBS repeat-containing protein [Roseicyclus sp. F158]MDT0682350.1 VCBS repeat-containing protein [Roseicyclus sp. F158]